MYITRIQIHSDRYPTQRFYPFNVSILQGMPELVLHKPIAFFVGENGSGKSTLLEAITRKCGIHMWDKPRRHLAHENPYETRLSDYVEITWTSHSRTNGGVPGSIFRAETFREFADFLDDVALCDPGRLQYHGGRILNTLSHGQGILSYLSGRYEVQGLYLLDEPESALSPASQIEFLKHLRRFEARGHAQFIIATHSPILLAHPNAQIFSFDPPCIQEINYEDTSHFKIYQQFFADRGAFLEASTDDERHS